MFYLLGKFNIPSEVYKSSANIKIHVQKIWNSIVSFTPFTSLIHSFIADVYVQLGTETIGVREFLKPKIWTL